SVSLQSDLHHLAGPRPGDWWLSPPDLARRHLVGGGACGGAVGRLPAPTTHTRPAPRIRKMTVTAIDASEALRGNVEGREKNGSTRDSAAVCDADHCSFGGWMHSRSDPGALCAGALAGSSPW